VGPRTSLDVRERRKILPLPGLELRPLGRPAHSYPGSSVRRVLSPVNVEAPAAPLEAEEITKPDLVWCSVHC
jgi:hypothetical protein